jgi:molybdopterin biosynthesis enzyme MoaB
VDFAGCDGQRKATQNVIGTLSLVGLGAGMKVVYSKQVTHAIQSRQEAGITTMEIVETSEE